MAETTTRIKGDNDYFSRNNFDLVRLIAASQVVVIHCNRILHVPSGPVSAFFEYFPGVPIFFFVSGFLISASWERSHNLHAFAVNRILRIYPALWIACFFSAGLLFSLGPSSPRHHIGGMLLWFMSQLTFLQQWNPPFLRSYGTGVMNGALWTIPVELCFYASTPLIYYLGKKLRSMDAVLAGVIAISFGIQYWANLTAPVPIDIVRKAILLTPFAWIGMFCVGVLAQRHIAVLYRFVAGKFLYFLIGFVAVSVASVYFPAYPVLGTSGNSIGLLNYPLLCALTLSAAYSWRGGADRLLHRNDFSYGIYIYHLPILNAALAAGFVGTSAAALTLCGAPLCAVCSWFFVEKPALNLRKKVLYSRNAEESEIRTKPH